MSDKNKKMTDLASRYLDLWQNQITAMATDAETAKAIERSMLMFNQGMSAFTGTIKNVKKQAEETIKAEKKDATAKPSYADFANFNMNNAIAAMQNMMAQNINTSFKGPLGTGTGNVKQTENNQTTSNGTKTSSASSNNADVDVGELLRSIKSMEERIIKLESDAAKRSGNNKE
jgi:hypothetical protein